MNPELRLRLVVLLNLISLTFCMMGFFEEHWAEGSPPSIYKDAPLDKDALKDLEYKNFSNIGILTSCVYSTCIPNLDGGDSLWKFLASFGIVSVICLATSTSLSAVQICYENTWIRYLTLATHLVGVILYTVMLWWFYEAMSALTLSTGFFLAIFADMLALCAIAASCFTVFKANKVEAIS